MVCKMNMSFYILIQFVDHQITWLCLSCKIYMRAGLEEMALFLFTTITTTPKDVIGKLNPELTTNSNLS
jgi:hypothetical protein